MQAKRGGRTAARSARSPGSRPPRHRRFGPPGRKTRRAPPRRCGSAVCVRGRDIVCGIGGRVGGLPVGLTNKYADLNFRSVRNTAPVYARGAGQAPNGGCRKLICCTSQYHHAASHPASEVERGRSGKPVGMLREKRERERREKGGERNER